MKNKFKFGDLVKLKNDYDKNGYGVVTRIDNNKITVYWKDSYYGAGTDTSDKLELYVDSSSSILEKVMKDIGIEKNVPVYLYYSSDNNIVPYSPFTFTGNDFVDGNGDGFSTIIIDIIFGDVYIGTNPKFPQVGNQYYYVTPKGTISSSIWSASSYDYALKLIRNVFKTKEEAECHITEILEKYHGVK